MKNIKKCAAAMVITILFAGSGFGYNKAVCGKNTYICCYSISGYTYWALTSQYPNCMSGDGKANNCGTGDDFYPQPPGISFGDAPPSCQFSGKAQ